MALKDLSMTPKEAKETMLGYTEADVKDAPKYPYGTSLDLNNETLAKLGITKLPAVGDAVSISAIGKVTRISAYEEQGGSEQCLGIQITDMEISMGGQTSNAASKLYGTASTNQNTDD